MSCSYRIRNCLALLVMAAAVACGTARADAPVVVWAAPNPGLLSANLTAVAWSPGGTLVADGNTTRWVRVRQASNGRVVTEILQPRHTDAVTRLLFSNDGRYLAVGNASPSLSFNVYPSASATLLGQLVATIDGAGIARYAPDARLAAAPGTGLQLQNWKLGELPVFVTTGSGYRKVTTRFQLAPNGAFQTATRKGQITVQRASDGTVLAVLAGFTSAFSADSSLLAVWTPNPSQVRLYRTMDWAQVIRMTSPDAGESIGALRFSAGGETLIASGYLPFLDADGLWDQKGIVRFWRGADGTLLETWDEQTGLAVTSGVALSPDATRILYGIYEGTTIAAFSP